MDTPQVLATFLALGEFIYCPKAGFFMYWHKHGCCCFRLEQHEALGGDDDVKAGKHGDSEFTEHVTENATLGVANTITRIASAQTVMFVADLMV